MAWDNSKTRVTDFTSGGKPSKVRLGAMGSKATPSPLGAKKDYSKKKKGDMADDFGTAGFGNTGMSGES